MNPQMLDIALPDNPDLKLQKIPPEVNDQHNHNNTKASFEMIAEGGDVVGYLKTWQEEDGYAGYVRFDSEGNVQDWKVLRDAR